MNFIDSVLRRFGYARENITILKLPKLPQRTSRSYTGAANNRLTMDWGQSGGGTDADQELRGGIKSLRDRVRERERNDDYMRRYFSLLNNNVLGAKGIQLQMKIQSDLAEIPDEPANDAIETSWERWGRKEFCTVTRSISWRGLCQIVLKSAKRDGGVLLRKIKPFDNEFGYALQPLEIDHLDVDLNRATPGENEIRMGVEFDQWGAPAAYHIFTTHPGAYQGNAMLGRRRIRVPVDEILHIFLPDRIGQTIGAPAPSATVLGLKMLAAYHEAELTAAREAACKGYAITQAMPDGYQGEDDGTGRQLQDVEPGMGLLLNPGETFQEIDPKHPVEAFPAFTKSVLRQIAAGLGVSYTSLANDLEGVNYSSIRAGLLEEREEWKLIQEWLIEELFTPIFEDWLEWSLYRGNIKLPNGSALPFRKFDQFNKPCWIPRRWDWVDPLKDVQAAILEIGAKLNSRQRVIAESGGDMEEVDEEIAKDPVTADLDSTTVYTPAAAPVSQGGDQPPPAPRKLTSVDSRFYLNGKDH